MHHHHHYHHRRLARSRDKAICKHRCTLFCVSSTKWRWIYELPFQEYVSVTLGLLSAVNWEDVIDR